MADPPITFRNLTSTAIHVKHYETIDLGVTNSGVGRFANLTNLWSTPANAKVSETSLTDVSLVVKPLGDCKANIKPARVPHQTMSVYFDIEGDLYQTSILHPRCHSQRLMPLTGNPHSHYTAVYHPEHHHLAIFCGDQLESWMGELKDEISLAALSIPGTHNSPTHHRALPSVRCQVASVPEQLQQGVRFLDVRVQPEGPLDPSKDKLILVHSVFPVSLTGPRYFRTLMDEVLHFLDQNPRETIIMSIKREGTGDATDSQLSRILRDHYVKDGSRWFTAPRIPTLGEARGKIVLIRRFILEERLKNEWGGAGWGINADTCADNSPHSLCPSGDVCIQDFYEVLDTEGIEKKVQYSIDHLKRAAQTKYSLSVPDGVPNCSESKQPFYINFLTASNFWKMGCWPDRIAAKLNPAIVDYLCTKHDVPEEKDDSAAQGHSPDGDGSTGIVVCDWVGHNGNWDIVKCIVGMNGRLEAKKHS